MLHCSRWEGHGGQLRRTSSDHGDSSPLSHRTMGSCTSLPHSSCLLSFFGRAPALLLLLWLKTFFFKKYINFASFFIFLSQKWLSLEMENFWIVTFLKKPQTMRLNEIFITGTWASSNTKYLHIGTSSHLSMETWEAIAAIDLKHS